MQKRSSDFACISKVTSLSIIAEIMISHLKAHDSALVFEFYWKFRIGLMTMYPKVNPRGIIWSKNSIKTPAKCISFGPKVWDHSINIFMHDKISIYKGSNVYIGGDARYWYKFEFF